MFCTGTLGFTFDCTGVDWTEAASVIERAPLGTRDPVKMRRAFENSQRVCFAWDRNVLIGMGRALTDFEYQAAVYDLVLLPEYQRRGLGTSIMRALLEDLDIQTVTLYAMPDKVGFYEKLGFIPFKTAMGLFDDPDKMIRLGLA